MQAKIVAGGVEVTSGGDSMWLAADEARAFKRWLIEHDLDLWTIIDEQLKREQDKGEQGIR